MHCANHKSGGMEGGWGRGHIFFGKKKGELKKPADLFSINALRVPRFMLDVDVHNMKLLEIKDLPHGSGWGTVPTPMF